MSTINLPIKTLYPCPGYCCSFNENFSAKFDNEISYINFNTSIEDVNNKMSLINSISKNIELDDEGNECIKLSGTEYLNYNISINDFGYGSFSMFLKFKGEGTLLNFSNDTNEYGIKAIGNTIYYSFKTLNERNISGSFLYKSSNINIFGLINDYENKKLYFYVNYNLKQEIEYSAGIEVPYPGNFCIGASHNNEDDKPLAWTNFYTGNLYRFRFYSHKVSDKAIKCLMMEKPNTNANILKKFNKNIIDYYSCIIYFDFYNGLWDYDNEYYLRPLYESPNFYIDHLKENDGCVGNFTNKTILTDDNILFEEFKGKINYSLSFWIKLDDYTYEGNILNLYFSESDSEILDDNINNGGLSIRSYKENTLLILAPSKEVSSNISYVDNQEGTYNIKGLAAFTNTSFNKSEWYNIAVSVEKIIIDSIEKSKISVYINGILETSVEGNFTNIPNEISDDFSLLIGGKKTGTNLFENGYIDDIKFYNKTITADEALLIYDKTK